MKTFVVSEIDILHLKLIRQNVRDFLHEASRKYDRKQNKLLDIAPQIYEGAKEFFVKSDISTLDIDKNSGADYIADLCKDNSDLIPANSFDTIVCAEVLEHTLNPFNAVAEIKRMLKPGGIALITVPFNFRIHGPLPDCWRFTEHGLRQLFAGFSEITLNILETDSRDLMPVHYTLTAIK